jgi:hypothetical protein
MQSRRRLFALSTFICLVLAGAAWTSITKHNLSGRTMADKTGRQPEMQPDLELARLLLIAGRPQQAHDLFSKAQHNPSASAGWSEGRVVFYVALCSESRGDAEEARFWYKKARRISFPELDNDDVAFFDVLMAYPRENQTACLVASTMWLPTAMLAADGADPLGEVVAHVKQSRKQFQAEKTVANQVRLGTWLLMFGELATERKELGLWSRASDAFDEGMGHITRVQLAIDKDPKLEQQIAKEPAIAMRLDDARVRKEQIDKRQQLARAEEVDRLNQLRGLVRAYRDLTQQMAMANVSFLLESYDNTRDANDQVLKELAAVQDIVKQRKDYYLFSDEPRIDDDADFKLINTVPDPVSQEMVSCVKALQAMAAYRLAMKNSGQADPKLLAEARSWAENALGETQPADGASASGQDKNNVLAHFVLGLAHEALGVQQTRERPGDLEKHKEARQHFDVAKSHLERVVAISKERGGKDGPLSRMAQEAEECTRRLQSAAPFLTKAAEFTRQGEVREAWEQLKEGVQRHPVIELWLAQVEAGRRARMEPSSLLADLDSAVTGGVVPMNDYRVSLVRTKVSLPGIWKTIAQSETAPQPAAVLGQAVKDLQRDEALLRAAALSAAGDPPAQAQINAFLALAIAYNAMIARSDANTEGRLKEGYRLARDAAAALELQLKNPSDSAQEMAGREALIASRLASGYLSVRVLPDYRDEAMLAFAAAFDEMAKLPFLQADVKLLGSPMIAAVARRTGEAGTKLAMEERRQRQAMTLCAEAALALHFGQPTAAAEQMKAAVRAAEESIPNQQTERLPNAAQLLSQADGFEAKVALRDSMHAFEALADVAAGRQQEALRECLGVLVPESLPQVQPGAADLTNDALLTQAVSRVQSPLLGHALAVSLDACCDCLPSGPNPQREVLVRQAKAAQKRTSELFASLPLQSRYPHVAAMNQETGRRLAAPDYYLQSAAAFRRRGDLASAAGRLEEGLQRHTNSPELWRTLLEVQIEQVQQGGATAAGYSRIIERLAVAEQQKLLAGYLVNFYRGAVYERMGKPAEALAAYEQALSEATAPADRVRARSKAAALRTRTIAPQA